MKKAVETEVQNARNGKDRNKTKEVIHTDGDNGLFKQVEVIGYMTKHELENFETLRHLYLTMVTH